MGGHVVIKAVQIVPLSVFNIGQIQHCLAHGHFRAVKNGGFVHVVPNMKRIGGAIVCFEEITPPRANFF